ncbi:MAG: hypothetical protein JWO99_331 [Candidatus Saccharibacteria bacterium]|nr:hypothetical protein [Candidatus Saccharibacteria bacterium]
MRPAVENAVIELATPLLIEQAKELNAYTASLSTDDIKRTMHVSQKLAEKTRDLLQGWTDDLHHQRAAIDSFLGDIYSGMQVGAWTDEDRLYANDHLRILSGMYGILRPLDGTYPYRSEMGYKFPNLAYRNLYTFWGDKIAKTLPAGEMIVDLSAVEYGKTVTQYVDPERIITPRFLTVSPKTGEPVFVVVHAKIARGAFASWMVRHRIEGSEKLKEFNKLGYAYSSELSTSKVPVFICQEFGGIGLSVRLT